MFTYFSRCLLNMLAAVILPLWLALHSAAAAAIYYEDFEDATLEGNTTVNLGSVAGGQADFDDTDTSHKAYLMVRNTTDIQFTSAVMTLSFDTVAPVTIPDGEENELLLRGGPGTSNSMFNSSSDVIEVILFRNGNRESFQNNGNESVFVVLNNQTPELKFLSPVDGSVVTLGENSYAAYVRDNDTGDYGEQKGPSAFDDVSGSMAIDRFAIGNANNGYQGTFSLDNVRVESGIPFEVVPEPTTIVLAALAMLGVAGCGRRRHGR
jgi:PEP-CTERM motif